MPTLNRRLQSCFSTFAACAATLVAMPHADAAELLERAVLAAETFAPGPTSGQFTSGGNGFVTPFINRQPVQGFSGVLPGPTKNTYLVMVDNGFGSKPSSPDALLRVYAVKPDFKTGTVSPVNRFSGDELASFSSESYFTLRDPGRKIPFAIVADGVSYPGAPVSGGSIPVDPSIRSQRLLTGADFDIESIRRAPDGTFWFGEEFGPYLIHTDAHGRVLEAPIPLPNFRKLPTTPGGTDVNPLVQAVSNPQRTLAANLPDSGGFEGMALNASRNKLYTLLEKAVSGDPVRTRLIISEFSLHSRSYTGKTYGYIMDAASNAIGDFTALSDRQFLVIERDGGQGNPSDPRFTSPARFKKIFKIDLARTGADGNLLKEEVADLMNLYDPRDVAGDGRTNTVFTFPFTTIEDVLVLDNNRLLVINDNNFPFSSGREFGVADNGELIVIHTAPLLSEECRNNDHDKDHAGDKRRWDTERRGRGDNDRPGRDKDCGFRPFEND